MEVVLVAWWLLAFLALGALGYPIAARLFPRFPAAGAGFAPTVAVATMTLVALWTGRLAFGRHALWVSLLALAGFAALAGLDRSAIRDREVRIADDLPFERRPVGEAIAVFGAAYLLLVFVRAADPAVSPLGGEKFLDYGLLRTMLRAESLPPYDVWFAGETLNYYYGGHLAAALVTLLAATDPPVAYNLALAGFYAMLVANAYALAGAIAAHNGVDRRRAALLGAFFVGLASNLLTVIRLVIGILPEPLRLAVAEVVASGSRIDAEEIAVGAEGFHYWTASRVIPGTINEFPVFGWLNGDLHAHMMAAPFLLFAAAVAFAYWQTPGEDRRRRRALAFGVLPVLGGLQVVVHTWDAPTVFGVAWLAAALAPAQPLTLFPGGERVIDAVGRRLPNRTGDELLRTGGGLAVAGVAGAAGLLLGTPFLLSASGGQEIALLDPGERSGLAALLLVHGAFVLAFGTYLVDRVGRGATLPLLGGLAAVVAVALLVDFAALALVVPLLALGWLAVRFDRDVGFETALLVGGAGLLGLVELVYVVELAGPGRLNTVFKAYFQVWVLWGVAIGVVLADLWSSRPISPKPTVAADSTAKPDGSDGLPKTDGSDGLPKTDGLDDLSKTDGLDGLPKPGPRTRGVAVRAFVALVVLSAAPYAPLALSQHFDRHDVGSLDATAYADRQYPEEAEAIRWLERNADRSDVLLEAPGTGVSPEDRAADPGHPGTYTWGANPASSLTGIPTVAGWAHQVGYRGVDPYYDRVADVDRAYAGDDAARIAVLDEYHVTYVWVGPAEETRYGDVEFAHLEGVELAFENDAVRIYRVERRELDTRAVDHDPAAERPTSARSTDFEPFN